MTTVLVPSVFYQNLLQLEVHRHLNMESNAVMHVPLQVQSEAGNFAVLYNNDDITSNVSTTNASYSTTLAEVTRTSNDSITSVFSNGASVTVTLTAGIPNFVLRMPQSFRGSSRGLLGNFNGNSTDDFIYPNSTVLSSDPTDRMIHEFGQACENLSLTR